MSQYKVHTKGGQYKLLLSSQRLLTDENGAVVSSRSYARNDTGVNERVSERWAALRIKSSTVTSKHE